MVESSLSRVTKAVVESGQDDPEWLRTTLVRIDRWLNRGDGVAVYENADLSHGSLGEKKFVSFGGPEAQLEVDVPPDRLPDIGDQINWRYVLVAFYRET